MGLGGKGGGRGGGKGKGGKGGGKGGLPGMGMLGGLPFVGGMLGGGGGKGFPQMGGFPGMMGSSMMNGMNGMMGGMNNMMRGMGPMPLPPWMNQMFPGMGQQQGQGQQQGGTIFGDMQFGPDGRPIGHRPGESIYDTRARQQGQGGIGSQIGGVGGGNSQTGQGSGTMPGLGQAPPKPSGGGPGGFDLSGLNAPANHAQYGGPGNSTPKSNFSGFSGGGLGSANQQSQIWDPRINR